MNNVFDKLEKLEKIQVWHESSIEIFKNWRKELHESEIDDDFLKQPKVIELSEYLKSTINSVNKELQENREMSDRARDYLFALKEVSTVIYKSFSKEELNNKVKLIEDEIEEELKKYGNQTA